MHLCVVALGATVLLPIARVATAQVPASPPSAPAVPEFDHVTIAIDSLERGIRLLQQLTGVVPVRGGVHPTRRTHNAVISLGAGRYLELVAPDPKDSVRLPSTTAMASYGLPRPIGWAVRVRNADTTGVTVRQSGLPGGDVVNRTMTLADGSALRWRALTPWGSLNRATLPYFIEWNPGPHPSTQAPAGCTPASLRLRSARPDSLRALLIAARLSVAVDSAAFEGIQLVLECPVGRVEMPMAFGKRFSALREQPPPMISGVALGVDSAAVEAALGKPARIADVDSSRTLLTYHRGRPDALQVILYQGKVAGINMLTPEAGSLDSVVVGTPFVRLMGRWGEPTIMSDRQGIIWRADGWEIVGHPGRDSELLGPLQLRINGIRRCPFVPDSVGGGRFVCTIRPD